MICIRKQTKRAAPCLAYRIRRERETNQLRLGTFGVVAEGFVWTSCRDTRKEVLNQEREVVFFFSSSHQRSAEKSEGWRSFIRWVTASTRLNYFQSDWKTAGCKPSEEQELLRIKEKNTHKPRVNNGFGFLRLICLQSCEKRHPEKKKETPRMRTRLVGGDDTGASCIPWGKIRGAQFFTNVIERTDINELFVEISSSHWLVHWVRMGSSRQKGFLDGQISPSRILHQSVFQRYCRRRRCLLWHSGRIICYIELKAKMTRREKLASLPRELSGVWRWCDGGEIDMKRFIENYCTKEV